MNNPGLVSGTSGIDFSEANPNLVVRVAYWQNWGSDKMGGYSTDGGATWHQFASVPSGADGGRIAISPDATSIGTAHLVWILKGGEVYYSANGGGSWVRSNETLYGPGDMYSMGRQPLTADRVQADTFYAYDKGRGSVLRSTNGGLDWTPIITGLASNSWQYKITAAPNVAGEILLSIAYVSAVKITHAHTGTAVMTTLAGVGSNTGLIAYGKPAPGKSTAMYIRGWAGGENGTFRSDDGAANWVRIDDPARPINDFCQTLGASRQVYGRVYVGTNGRGIFYNMGQEEEEESALVIRPTSATARDALGSRPAANTIATTGSGFTTDEHALMEPEDAVPSPWPNVDSAYTYSWQGTKATGTYISWICWELGDSYTLQGLHVWNVNNVTARGSKDVDVKISNDVTAPADWSVIPVAHSFTLTRADGLSTYTGEDQAFSSLVTARWVYFGIKNNHGDTYVGLDEIRFLKVGP
jgi:hypothetical protein